MIRYGEFESQSTSLNTRVLTTIFTGLASCSTHATLPVPEPEQIIQHKPYILLNMDQSTSITGLNYIVNSEDELHASPVSFEEDVAMFFEDLMSKQQPLGEEFAEVLYSNLEDLYY